MLNYLYFMDFLYFPEDKADYIPGIIALVIFFAGAAVVTYFIVRKSRNDEEKFEREFLNKQDDQKESNQS